MSMQLAVELDIICEVAWPGLRRNCVRVAEQTPPAPYSGFDCSVEDGGRMGRSRLFDGWEGAEIEPGEISLELGRASVAALTLSPIKDCLQQYKKM